MIKNITKRDGRLIPFNKEKITRAIFLAAQEAALEEGKKADYKKAESITEDVVNYINKKYIGEVPNVENIQDAIIKILIEGGER